MKKVLAGAAAIASLTLGFTAHASCVDPRNPGSGALSGLQQLHASEPGEFGGRGIDERIVGTWLVVYTPTGSTTASGEAFIQWHSDGTEWEYINYPTLNGNICLGSWKALDAEHVSRNHFGWLYNDGSLAGWFNETETNVVAWDGSSYTGTNETTLHFYPVPPATEGTTVVLKGTAKATRLAP
jgi:hypothetical protein